MQKNIHPEIFKDATITCLCGNVQTIAGTVKEQRVEICSACHPFYTGTEKILDQAGRIDKFNKKWAKVNAA
ncbi:50S ribosomal protein L31 [Candidatus Peregrinibacteria bacterium]|nr:MAG: 50S ribosomal protein L31 [Candidatus Peregrinibacteria bacterium]